MRLAPGDRSQIQTAEWTGYMLPRWGAACGAPTRRGFLVAGYGFGGFFGGAWGAVAVAIAVSGSDCYWLACVGEIGWGGFGDVRDRADLNHRGLGLLEDELFIDGAHFGLFLEGLLAARAIFFGGRQRNVVFEVADASGVIGINIQRVFEALKIDALALGVDFVFAVVLVPLGNRRVLVHVFDDLAPAYARVVGAEGNFALLRGVGDDAHFGAAEVVVEKILEPHAGDEEEVPRILAALHGVVDFAIRRSAAVLGGGALGERPGLVKLLEERAERQALGSAERVIVFQEGHGHHEVREILAASRVGDGSDVFRQLHRIEET